MTMGITDSIDALAEQLMMKARANNGVVAITAEELRQLRSAGALRQIPANPVQTLEGVPGFGAAYPAGYADQQVPAATTQTYAMSISVQSVDFSNGAILSFSSDNSQSSLNYLSEIKLGGTQINVGDAGKVAGFLLDARILNSKGLRIPELDKGTAVTLNFNANISNLHATVVANTSFELQVPYFRGVRGNSLACRIGG